MALRELMCNIRGISWTGGGTLSSGQEDQPWGAAAMPGKLEITSMDMRPGTTLKLKGRIADDTSSFTINLGQSADKLDLHFNPRFHESTIVCNSLDGSSWGQEQRDSHLCFSPGSEVKLTVAFQEDGFKVTLPDGHQLTFPNRLGHSRVSYLGVKHFHISSFKLD